MAVAQPPLLLPLLLLLLLMLVAQEAIGEHVTLLLVADGSSSCELGHARVALEVTANRCVASPLLGGALRVVLDSPGACSRQGGATLQPFATLAACTNASRAPLLRAGVVRLALDNQCLRVQWTPFQRRRSRLLVLQARCHPHPRRILALQTPVADAGGPAAECPLPDPAASKSHRPAAPLTILGLALAAAVVGLIFRRRHALAKLRSRLLRDLLGLTPFGP